MKKNVLILSSSPRIKGNSDLLCDRFLEGAKDAGHNVEKIFLNSYASPVYGMFDEEKLENLIRKIDELKEKIGIKKTIREYGVDEQVFLNTLDEMSEKAFDDQCTGANPRYPLISEIKDIYLKVYYGN